MTLLVSGGGALERVGEILPPGASRVLVVHTHTVAAYAQTVVQACTRTGRMAAAHVLADGEGGKTLRELNRLWSSLAAAGLTRADAVVAVGGGACTDAAGFAAATWLRGIPWVAVPTTTLGMIDAAHGGKTALNTLGGKNLVGAFHEPEGVVIDTDTLRTLGERDLRAGLVEALKSAWLGGFTVDDPLGAGRDDAIRQAAEFKRHLVARDPLEHGDRVWLNYGHTLGHAIEAASDYRLRHGETVAVGMVFAAEVAQRLGVADAGLADRHREQLAALGVPTTWRGEWDTLTPFLRHDKKRGAAGQRWILLAREGQPRVSSGVPDTVLREALTAIA